MQIKGCPAWRDYDVFGLPTVNGCCYSYMKFCKDVETCPVKEVIKKCKSAMNYTSETGIYVTEKAITNLMEDILGTLGYGDS